MYQTNPPRASQKTLPTMYDLPSETVGEAGLPDEFHCMQADLLQQTCQLPNQPVDEVFIASDLNLYYDPRHPLWYKRPDWFLVLGVSRYTQQQDLRLSYVIWQEGVSPFLIVELLSPGTEAEDLGQTLQEVNKPPTKWEVYERMLRVPYYVIYDRYQNQLRAFRLNGTGYEAMGLANQRLWLAEIELGLGLWQGSYQETTGLWLRWYDAAGWILTEAELVEQERQRAEQERQRAEQAEQQLAQERQQRQHLLAQLKALSSDQLKELGIDLESLG